MSAPPDDFAADRNLDPDQNRAPILVTGATGYIGGRLVPALLADDHRIRCLVRSPAKLASAPWSEQVEIVEGSVTDEPALDRAMADVDVAFYLVHSMGGSPEFDKVDRAAARAFREAASRAGVRRIVYLGGLGRDDDPRLSRHLRSRHEVGEVLADGPVPVTELRAALIIGSGSASFEMLRYLVEVLPVMITPRWVDNLCQPIAIRDVVHQLVTAAQNSGTTSEVIEIGGPDRLTYRQMMQTYAAVAGLKPRVIVGVPFLTPKLSSLWVSLCTPLPASLARPLVESLINEVVVTRPSAAEPPPGVLTFRESVELAVERSADLQVATRWSDAGLPGHSPADPLPTDPDWAGGSVLIDEKTVLTDATPEALFKVASGIGGDRGWYVAPLLWSLRGWLDKLVGGVGMRRGRRHPDQLRVGDALDFWRVEALEPPSLIRLRAEMRLPGEAWLEWHIDSVGDRRRLTQRAIFYPRGLIGRAYWYCLLPFHGVIFGRLARRLSDTAGREET